jgi:DNA-directed RNA polymerase alpha subunit
MRRLSEREEEKVRLDLMSCVKAWLKDPDSRLRQLYLAYLEMQGVREEHFATLATRKNWKPTKDELEALRWAKNGETKLRSEAYKMNALNLLDRLYWELREIYRNKEDDHHDTDVQTTDKRLDCCRLNVRTLNILKADGIETIGDLVGRGRLYVLNLKNVGKQTLRELDELVESQGLEWK